ncbi:MAG: hypothetical protein JNL90_21045 [Planctomycetes bacterium]|nr:hypothetical protein [Planctomycetota bacterium]
MELLRRRIGIEPAAAAVRRPSFEVAFLGHAPGEAVVAALTPFARARLVEIGLPVPRHRDELFHRPLALRSPDEFHALFPAARTTPTRYASRLAGATAWLPRAVEDFFRAGGSHLHAIVVPEADPTGLALSAADFLPPANGVELARPESWRGLAALLHLPQVGLVALPDLERLAIAAEVVGLPEKRLPNPIARFVPVSAPAYEPGAERRNEQEMEAGRAPRPIDTLAAVPPLLDFLARWRPDVSLLWTLPLEKLQGAPEPTIAAAALRRLREWRGEPPSSTAASSALSSSAPSASAALPDERLRWLARLSPLFPYLKGPRYQLLSPSGVVAGAIAARATADGAWRSVAGRPLPSDAVPTPAVATASIAPLRAQGIGVLTHEGGALQLDDERTAAPGAARSAEGTRLRGWLLRELEQLGLELVFAPENAATPTRLALEQWLTDLFRRGALAGRTAADAFAVRELPRREGQLAFEIELAPSAPIDRLVLAFVNEGGRWQAEALDG